MIRVTVSGWEEAGTEFSTSSTNRTLAMRLRPRRHPAEADLIALLDNELSPPERQQVEAHLIRCGPCAGLRLRHERAHAALAADLAADLVDLAAPPAVPAVHWRVRPAARVAGAGVVAGSIGALAVASLLLARHYRRLTPEVA